MKRYIKPARITFLTLFLGTITNIAAHGQDSAKLKAMLSEITYGVPASPAFELLPNKPSQVAHLTSGKDIAAQVNNFVNNGRLQAGAAVDGRPFAWAVKSLNQYQHQPFKQILWRSVFSLGTAAETQTNNDVYIGAGLRIPVIDKSDLRADPRYTTLLEAYQLQALGQYPQPEFNESAADYDARVAQLKNLHNMKKLRDSLLLTKWNALRLDIGIGASERAASGYLQTDSLFKDRIGLWLAMGFPLTKIGQLTVSGNTAWIHAQVDTGETNRSVIGARARFFITSGFSLSGEYAYVISVHGDKSYNENWNHLAIAAEFKVPFLGGWAGLAYGGDSHHRTDAAAKFALNYAIYSDRLIKRN